MGREKRKRGHNPRGRLLGVLTSRAMMYGRKASDDGGQNSMRPRVGISRRPRKEFAAVRSEASVTDFDGVPAKELNTRDLFPYTARFLRKSVSPYARHTIPLMDKR